jgi:hypothetical protein
MNILELVIDEKILLKEYFKLFKRFSFFLSENNLPVEDCIGRNLFGRLRPSFIIEFADEKSYSFDIERFFRLFVDVEDVIEFDADELLHKFS